MSARFSLGDRVTITGTAAKVKTWRDDCIRGEVTYQEGPPPTRTYWTGGHCQITPFTSGVIVGSRTAQDGVVEWWEEEGTTYAPKAGTARNVWLVAFDMRRKPVMCFDHQVHGPEGGGSQ